jgi:hypothetical protein
LGIRKIAPIIASSSPNVLPLEFIKRITPITNNIKGNEKIMLDISKFIKSSVFNKYKPPISIIIVPNIAREPVL